MGGLAAATVVVLGVAVALLGHRQFWLDESLSWLIARQGPSGIASFATSPDGELNMVLYYAVLWPFTTVGADELWLRIPSLLAAAATVPLVWRLADRLDGRAVVRIGAVAIFLTQPLLVDFALETRSYAFTMLATAGLTVLLLGALDGSRSFAVGYAVSAALAVGVHFVLLLLVAAHVVAVLAAGTGPWRARAGRVARWCGPALLTAAAAATVYASQRTLTDRSPLGLRAVASAAYSMTGRAGPLTFAFLAALGFGARALLRRRTDDPAVLVPLLTVVIPPGLLLVMSLSRPVVDARYLLGLLPVLVTIVAIGLAAALPGSRSRVAAIGTFVVLGLAGQAFIYRTPDREAPDPASDLVLAAAVDGDLVAFDSFGAAAPFRHRVAVTGAAGPGGAVPAEAGPAPAEDNPLEPVVLRPLAEAAPEVPADGSVWVIRNRSDQLSRSAVAEPLSDAGFAPVAAWELGAVDLERWQRR